MKISAIRRSMSYGENKVVVAPDCGIFDARPEVQNGGNDMSENRCQCGGLRHKHDIERIAALESSLAQAQADVEALRDALLRIVQWSEAYPLDAFPEPDFKKARELWQAG